MKRKDDSHDSPLQTQSRTPESEDRLRQLQRLERELGFTFQDHALLERALTHSSCSHVGSRPNYEGLEFLGDSVLGFLISDALYRRHPDLSEGELSKMKGFLVSRNQLHRLSAELGLGEYLRLGRGEEKTGGRLKKAILADVFESVAAAVYLEGGLEAARAFVLGRFEPLLRKLDRREIEFKDYKSRLQELVHARGLAGPRYRVAEEAGPDHRKEFLVEVWIGGRAIAQGRGRSKKEAEQKAASLALSELVRGKPASESGSNPG